MSREAAFYRFLQRTFGTQWVARELAAQDVPLEAALALLGIRPSR